MGRTVLLRLTFTFCLLLSWLASQPAKASSVINMNAARLSHHAGQVIRADIERVDSYFATNPKRIETRLRLTNIDYWKGGYDDAPATFDLIVPGGRVDETEMRICCAPLFKADQQWVLFLLPSYKTFPTVGLGQGSFQVKATADGDLHIYQEGFAAITGITNAGDFQYAAFDERPAHAHAVTHRLTMRPKNVGPQQPVLTLEQFRNALQPILDNSHNFGLSTPAGRRIMVQYQPTNLKRVVQKSKSQPVTRGAEESVEERAVKQKARLTVRDADASKNNNPDSHAGQNKNSQAKGGKR